MGIFQMRDQAVKRKLSCLHPAEPVWTHHTHPKFHLDFEAVNSTYTLRKYGKVYYTHNEALWGDQKRHPSRSENGLGKPEFAWFELSESDERGGSWIFLSTCPDMRQKGKGK